MSAKKKSTSTSEPLYSDEVIQRAREWRERLDQLYEDLNEDPELEDFLKANHVCVRCNSTRYEYIIDEDQDGLVWCCSDCPEDADYH